MTAKISKTIATHDKQGNLTGSMATTGKTVPTPSASGIQVNRVSPKSNARDLRPRPANVTRWEALYDSDDAAVRDRSALGKLLFGLPPENEKRSRITVSDSVEPSSGLLRCVIVPAEGRKTTMYFWGETAYSDVIRYAQDNGFGYIDI